MFMFAIIDDRQSDIDKMRDKIKQYYFKKSNLHYHCDEYLSCKDFPIHKYYDVIFLDIEMPEIDGFAFAKKINQTYNPKIIFMTNHDSLVVSTFDYKPFHFIQKNKFNESSEHVLELLYNNLFEKDIKVSSDVGIDYISLNQISYINIDKNIVHIQTFNKKVYTTWDSLTTIYKNLNPHIFVRINQSVIVNMEYIKEIDPSYSYLILKDDSTFDIATRIRATFKKQYRDFRLR